MSQYTVNFSHRFTESGVSRLYFSSGEKIAKTELGNHDVTHAVGGYVYSNDYNGFLFNAKGVK